MDAAIITGITGQLSYYLVESLSIQNIPIFGIKRRTSRNNTSHLQKWITNGQLQIIEGDVSDPFSARSFINKVLNKYQNITIFNTAAQSHVHTSFEQPQYTFDVNFGGVLNILEIMKEYPDRIRLVQCSTSEMYGDNYDMKITSPALFEQAQLDIVYNKYQNENTKFSPMSPYAVSKVAAHQLINNYRKAYNLHASCAIMFNYESKMRSDEFLTQKVCRFVKDLYSSKMLKMNFNKKLKLGNLYSYRDFTFAGDTANAVILMSQQPKPDDYVICSGNTIMIQDFVKKAFEFVGEDYTKWVEIDQEYIRPSEVDYLRGDNAKITQLGWSITLDVDGIIKHMVQNAAPRV